MDGFIVAIATMGAILVTAIVLGVVKVRSMEKKMTVLAKCLLTFIDNPDKVDVIREYDMTSTKDGSDFTFPDIEGF